MMFAAIIDVILGVTSSRSYVCSRRVHKFRLMSQAWSIDPAPGAVPINIGSLSSTDARFEAMSGSITTGATVKTCL